jgi:DNA polymerase III delta prime subunit
MKKLLPYCQEICVPVLPKMMIHTILSNVLKNEKGFVLNKQQEFQFVAESNGDARRLINLLQMFALKQNATSTLLGQSNSDQMYNMFTASKWIMYDITCAPVKIIDEIEHVMESTYGIMNVLHENYLDRLRFLDITNNNNAFTLISLISDQFSNLSLVAWDQPDTLNILNLQLSLLFLFYKDQFIRIRDDKNRDIQFKRPQTFNNYHKQQ